MHHEKIVHVSILTFRSHRQRIGNTSLPLITYLEQNFELSEQYYPEIKTVYLVLSDMSKFFDSVQRTTQLKDLRTIANYNEVHLLMVLFPVKFVTKFKNHLCQYRQGYMCKRRSVYLP